MRDKRVLRLIGKYLRAGVEVNGRLEVTRKGVPQGGPLSPLLANILLDDLDKELEQRGHRFARYADDFVILVRSQRAGERVMASVSRFSDNSSSSRSTRRRARWPLPTRSPFSASSSRGPESAGRTRHSQSSSGGSEADRPKLVRLHGVPLGQAGGISSRLDGLLRDRGSYHRPIPEIDHWLRRRVRMCYWKQWRRCRTKVRELTKLGTNLGMAISVGHEAKGPMATGQNDWPPIPGMTNQWLKDQGLLSVKELWVNIHYPATAR